jgi:hypothetical protein
MAIRKVIPRSLDSAAASTNLSFDANTLYVDSTNNVVGINTATPNSFATGLAVYNAANPSLAIVSGNANAYLRLYSTSDSDMYLSNVGGTMTFSTAATSRMTINSSGNVGIGTSSPSVKLQAESSSSTSLTTLYLVNSSTAAVATKQSSLSFRLTDTVGTRKNAFQLTAYSDSANGNIENGGLIFTGRTGDVDTEFARINSAGNLGLGVTPSAWSGYKAFEIGNAGSAVWSSGLTDIRLAANMYYNAGYKYAGTGVATRFELSSGGFYWYQAPSGTAGNAITFTQAMTLDASGNLGIGATASAKLSVSDTADPKINLLVGSIERVFINYTTSTTTASFDSDGDITLAPNNTALLRATATGNVGIGITPAAKLDILGSVGVAGRALKVTPSTEADIVANIRTSTIQRIANDTLLAVGYATTPDAWYISASYTSTGAYKPLAFATSDTERMRIDSSGNVGIGTSSPNSVLNVVGAQTAFDTNVFGQVLVRSTAAYNATPRAGIVFSVKYNSAGNYIAGGSSIQGYKQTAADGEFANGLLFTTQAEGLASAERALIDSSGNLLVGTISSNVAGRTGARVNIAAGSNDTMQLKGVSSSYLNIASWIPTTGTVYHIGFGDGTSSYTERGVISTNGTGTTYGTNSDYRLKENIAPMTGALDTVAKLKPVTYKWKTDGSDGQGFIAHELQAVVPDCVTGEKDAVELVDDLDAEGKKIGTKEIPRYQGIDTSFLVATLTSAIQEQQALIQSLTTRLTALENK